MGRIRRETDQLRIRHRHKPVHFLLSLDHLAQMIVQPGRKSHLTCKLTNLVTPGAQLSKGGGGVRSRLRAPRRENDQMVGAEIGQKLHCGARAFQHLPALRRIAEWPTPGDGDHMKIALRHLPVHFRLGQSILLEQAREAGKTDAEKARLFHYI